MQMKREVNCLIRRTERALKMIFLFLELPPGALRVDKSDMLTIQVEIMYKFIKWTNVLCETPWEEHLVRCGGPHSCS